MMRGSTLLLHNNDTKPVLSLWSYSRQPAPKRPSPLADRRPRTLYRLAVIPDGLLLFLNAGPCVFVCSWIV